jgi:MoxR-like ATPase
MDYPDKLEDEINIVLERSQKLSSTFPEPLLNATIRFVRELRENDKLQKKPSVRASIGLYERSVANAIIFGRKKVNFDDIKKAIVSVLSHRIALKPSVKYLQKPEDFIKEAFDNFSRQHNLADEEDLP